MQTAFKLNPEKRCAHCGSPLYYGFLANSETAITLLCHACQQVTETPKTEQSLHKTALEAANQAALEDTPHHFACPHCGANNTWSADQLARACDYCKTPLSRQQSAAEIYIHGVIPFALNAKQATQKIQAWLKSRWFAPNVLREMTGHYKTPIACYLPYWNFYADTHTSYQGMRGEYYWEYEEVPYYENGKLRYRTESVQKTHWYSVSGRVFVPFADVLFAADPQAKYANALKPFQLSACVPYQADYLQGLLANTTKSSVLLGFNEAKDRMASAITRAIYQDIGGDEQRITQQYTDYQAVAFQLLLLPVWQTGFAYQGKRYEIMVNGQTGKISGEYPKSFIKIALVILFVVCVVLPLIYYYLKQNGYLN